MKLYVFIGLAVVQHLMSWFANIYTVLALLQTPPANPSQPFVYIESTEQSSAGSVILQGFYTKSNQYFSVGLMRRILLEQVFADCQLNKEKWLEL